MFNKKSFFTILFFLFLLSIFNLFDDVTYKYVGISLTSYREFEINCGSAIEILSNIDNDDYFIPLGMDKNNCISSSVLKLINFGSTLIFILLVALVGIRYFRKKVKPDDLSDLIYILKRRNSK